MLFMLAIALGNPGTAAAMLTYLHILDELFPHCIGQGWLLAEIIQTLTKRNNCSSICVSGSV
jgi:hypothetical protein